MDIQTLLSLGQTALELGLICSLTVLALFLSYSMLNVCDLSTDGCFTLGAAVGAQIALMGHPFLAILAAMGAGVLCGFVTGALQTKFGINSLLAGIVVNTGLYSVNIAVMGGSSLLNMNKTVTVFTMMKGLLSCTPLAGYYKLIVALIAVILVIALLTLFLGTRLGLAIRATGNNPIMVKSSSINTVFTTIVGLCVANAFTGLSGCLLAQYQKSVNIDIGFWYGYDCTCLTVNWCNNPRTRKNCYTCRWCRTRFLYFPPCLHHRTSFPSSSIHAQAGIFYHCRHCTVFPIFKDTAPNDEAPTNSFKK